MTNDYAAIQHSSYESTPGTKVFETEPAQEKNWLNELDAICTSLPEGYLDTYSKSLLELKDLISRRIRLTRGIICTSSDIILTNSSVESDYLIGRVVLNPKVEIAFEDPTDLRRVSVFENSGARIRPLNTDNSGLVTDDLIGLEQTSFLYLMPSAQFPTGAMLPSSRRQKVARWATENRSFVIENDFGSDCLFDVRQCQAIKAMAPENVIYVGELSSFTAPVIQLSFIIAPHSTRVLIEREQHRIGSAPPQVVLDSIIEVLKTGSLQRISLAALRQARENRDVFLKALEEAAIPSLQYAPTQGGPYQLLRLDTSIDDKALSNFFVERSLRVVPLSSLYRSSPSSPGLVINFARETQDRLLHIVRRLRRALA